MNNCVYKITHPELKGCYVGSTKNLRKRRIVYKNDSINKPLRQYIYIH